MGNNDTRYQIKRMIDGMMYHCAEMSDFMSKHITDPYFETNEGRKLRKCMMGICIHHVSALTTFMMEKSTEDSDENDEVPNIDIESILKDMLDE